MLDPRQKRELLELFAGELREQSAEVTQLLRGVAAQDKDERISTLHAAMRLLHSIKGAAGSIGLDDLADRSHALEERLVEVRTHPDRLAVVDEVIADVEELARSVDRDVGRDGDATSDQDIEGGTVRITVHALDQVLEIVDALAPIHYQLEKHTNALRHLSESVDRIAERRRPGGGREIVATGPSQGDELRALRPLTWGLVNEYESALLHFDLRRRELEARLRTARVLPISALAPLMERTVNNRSREGGKRTTLEVSGGETGLDRSVYEELRSILVHLLNNAVDHGIETPDIRAAAGKPPAGRIRLTAQAAAGRARLTLQDDGAGVDVETLRTRAAALGLSPRTEDRAAILDLMFAPAVTTREVATAGSGRGAGLDAVRTAVVRMGGSITVESERGRGTRFTIDLPVTLATQAVLLVEAGGLPFALPLTGLERSVRLKGDAFGAMDGRPVVMLEDRAVAVGELSHMLGLPSVNAPGTGTRLAVVIDTGERRIALLIERLLGDQRVVCKPLPAHVGQPPLVSAASVLGDGQVVPILDLPAIAAAMLAQGAEAAMTKPSRQRRHTVLVVDDSVTTRASHKSLLELAGFRVLTATDGVHALELLAYNDCSLVVSDVNMPRLDGFELTARLRADERFRAVPILLVTSLDRVEDRKRGAMVGATDYLLKRDLSRGALVEAAQRFLGDA